MAEIAEPPRHNDEDAGNGAGAANTPIIPTANTLMTATKKGRTYLKPGQSRMSTYGALKKVSEEINQKRVAHHDALKALRAEDKKVRRAHARIAKGAKKFSLEDLVAAAAMKGMTIDDFGSLPNASGSGSDGSH